MSELIEINNNCVKAIFELGCNLVDRDDTSEKEMELFCEAVNAYRAMAIHACCEANACEDEAKWSVDPTNRIVEKGSDSEALTFVYLDT